eukprot:scaffold145238_cov17-Prasinocladus_malaysianus.AAC.1
MFEVAAPQYKSAQCNVTLCDVGLNSSWRGRFSSDDINKHMQSLGGLSSAVCSAHVIRQGGGCATVLIEVILIRMIRSRVTLLSNDR